MRADVSCRIVVTDGVLVHCRRLSSNNHAAAAIDRDAADRGGALPQHLGEMANVVEHIIGNTGLAKVPHHGPEFTLVPALRNASSDIKGASRDSEKVLALPNIGRDVMLEVACPGSLESSGRNGIVPYQRCSVVVGTSGIMVI